MVAAAEAPRLIWLDKATQMTPPVLRTAMTSEGRHRPGRRDGGGHVMYRISRCVLTKSTLGARDR